MRRVPAVSRVSVTSRGNLSGRPAKRFDMSGTVDSSANSGNNHGPVIVCGMSAREVFEGTKHGIEQGRGLQAARLQHPIEPSSAKHFTDWVLRVRDSIGVKDDLIAFLQLLRRFVVAFLG